MTEVQDPVVAAIGSQLAAALEMLERAIEACPDDLWRRPSSGMAYWHLSYHVLFFLDHDLCPVSESFISPDFGVPDFDLRDEDLPHLTPYTKEDMRAYLGSCRETSQSTLKRLTVEPALRLLGCARLNQPSIAVILYNLRHVQHHVGQLNLLLRDEGIPPAEWVRDSTLARS